MKLMNGLGILIAIAVFAAPLTASAEIIESYVPDEHDYGDVVLGLDETQIYTVVLADSGPLDLIGVTLVVDDHPVNPPAEYTGSSFVITSMPPLGEIDSGTSFEIEVTFAPAFEGPHQAYLRIESDESSIPSLGDIRIPIFGMGVLDEPEPGGEMADLIELFETSVDEGTIEGYGDGCRANRRLRAFRNFLNASNDLIDWGYEGFACWTLFIAYRKSDGIHPPPDFIEGENVGLINDGIVDVMDLLGCFE